MPDVGHHMLDGAHGVNRVIDNVMLFVSQCAIKAGGEIAQRQLDRIVERVESLTDSRSGCCVFYAQRCNDVHDQGMQAPAISVNPLEALALIAGCRAELAAHHGFRKGNDVADRVKELAISNVRHAGPL